LKLGQALSDESAVLKSLQETQEQMAAEAKHSETIARQRKRKVIQEARSPKTPKAHRVRSPEPNKSGVSSPNVHMGLVTSDIDATWGCAGEPAESSGEKEIVPLGDAFRNCCSDSIPVYISTPDYALQRVRTRIRRITD